MSSQYGVEFEEPDFDGIKKVVSIWLCMTSPAKKDSGITEYSFSEKNLVGQINNEKQAYDLIQTVMVYIGSSAERIESEFLKMLHLLFRAKMKAAEKQERLKEDFEIEIDHSMAKELNIMCNLSEGIAEEAREEGRTEGRIAAQEETTVRLAINMLKENIPCDVISRVTNLPVDKISSLSTPS